MLCGGVSIDAVWWCLVCCVVVLVLMLCGGVSIDAVWWC